MRALSRALPDCDGAVDGDGALKLALAVVAAALIAGAMITLPELSANVERGTPVGKGG